MPPLRRRAAGAAAALRFVAADEAEALLIDAQIGDPDADVRAAAATAFRYRSMSAQAFQVLRSDKSRAVRLAVLDILWQVRDRFPEVDSLVKTAAKDEADREVREAAVRPLASIQ